MEFILNGLESSDIQRMGYVYAIAAISSFISVIGGVGSNLLINGMEIKIGIFSASLLIVIFGTIGTIISLIISSQKYMDRLTQLLIFSVIAFFNGVSLGPIFYNVATQLSFQSIISTIVLFACYSFPVIVLLSFLIEKKIHRKLEERSFL